MHEASSGSESVSSSPGSHKQLSVASVQKTSAPNSPRRLKRPPNAFMLFSSGRRKELQTMYPTLSNAVLSQILGQEWRALSQDMRDQFFSQASRLREEFLSQHPGYKFERRKTKRRKYCRRQPLPPKASLVTTTTTTGVTSLDDPNPSQSHDTDAASDDDESGMAIDEGGSPKLPETASLRSDVATSSNMRDVPSTSNSIDIPASSRTMYNVPSLSRSRDVTSLSQSRDVLMSSRPHDFPLASSSRDVPPSSSSRDILSPSGSRDIPSLPRSHDLPSSSRPYDVPSTSRSRDSQSASRSTADAPTSSRSKAVPASSRSRDVTESSPRSRDATESSSRSRDATESSSRSRDVTESASRSRDVTVLHLRPESGRPVTATVTSPSQPAALFSDRVSRAEDVVSMPRSHSDSDWGWAPIPPTVTLASPLAPITQVPSASMLFLDHTSGPFAPPPASFRRAIDITMTSRPASDVGPPVTSPIPGRSPASVMQPPMTSPPAPTHQFPDIQGAPEFPRDVTPPFPEPHDVGVMSRPYPLVPVASVDDVTFPPSHRSSRLVLIDGQLYLTPMRPAPPTTGTPRPTRRASR